MTNQLQTKPASIIETMADKFGMDKRAFEATLKATVVPANISNEQFAAFLLVAKEYDLNPITKEIYAFPAKGGGIQPIVSVDGWCNLINSHPQMDGIEFEELKENDKVSAITCRIYRKDRSRPTIVTEYMSECVRNTDVWRTWGIRMLRHKSLIQCARIAFGFAGIIEQDEYERMVEAKVKPVAQDINKIIEAEIKGEPIDVTPPTNGSDVLFMQLANATTSLDELQSLVVPNSPECEECYAQNFDRLNDATI